MKLKDLYTALRAGLSESDARYVIQKRLGLVHSEIIADPAREIDPAEALNDFKRYNAGEPLSRIYQEREFWGLPFAISPATLDPRPDTETLIEAVLKRYKDNPPQTILDLGTGSGCILIALLHEFPHAHGVGVDLSQEALETAKANAMRNGVGERVHFLCSNWTDSIEDRFDLVVSNPPYIAESVIPGLHESVKNHDPILALQGGNDGLQAYKNIFSNLFSVLKPAGRAFFEIGFDQGESVTRLSKESGFFVQGAYPDLAGHIRVLELVADNRSGDK